MKRAPTDGFEVHRNHLFGIAYRMLGEVAGAEDVIQEAWLRWSRADGKEIRDARAWLSAIAVRLSLDALRAARNRRESYVGPWLPEPLLPDDMRALSADSPAYRSELASDLSLALLHVLERLTPEERAAFILHDAFDCDYAEIAAVLEKNEAACRKLVSRARERVKSGRVRHAATTEEHRALMMRFAEAAVTSDQSKLLTLFADDVVFYSDGGGRVPAALNPVRGADRVMRLIVGLLRKLGTSDLPTVTATEVNGQFALAIIQGDELHSVITTDAAEDRVSAIYVIRNPEKLSRYRRSIFPQSFRGSSASA
jgi:RNA polymerase sigma-70 factor (ECF subfamily)